MWRKWRRRSVVHCLVLLLVLFSRLLFRDILVALLANCIVADRLVVAECLAVGGYIIGAEVA